MRDYMERRVTSPTQGPPPPCKQALTHKYIFNSALALHSLLTFAGIQHRQTFKCAFKSGGDRGVGAWEIRGQEAGEERTGSGSSKRAGSREKCEMLIILI